MWHSQQRLESTEKNQRTFFSKALSSLETHPPARDVYARIYLRVCVLVGHFKSSRGLIEFDSLFGSYVLDDNCVRTYRVQRKILSLAITHEFYILDLMEKRFLFTKMNFKVKNFFSFLHSILFIRKVNFSKEFDSPFEKWQKRFLII